MGHHASLLKEEWIKVQHLHPQVRRIQNEMASEISGLDVKLEPATLTFNAMEAFLRELVYSLYTVPKRIPMSAFRLGEFSEFQKSPDYDGMEFSDFLLNYVAGWEGMRTAHFCGSGTLTQKLRNIYLEQRFHLNPRMPITNNAVMGMTILGGHLGQLSVQKLDEEFLVPAGKLFAEAFLESDRAEKYQGLDATLEASGYDEAGRKWAAARRNVGLEEESAQWLRLWFQAYRHKDFQTVLEGITKQTMIEASMPDQERWKAEALSKFMFQAGIEHKKRDYDKVREILAEYFAVFLPIHKRKVPATRLMPKRAGYTLGSMWEYHDLEDWQALGRDGADLARILSGKGGVAVLIRPTESIIDDETLKIGLRKPSVAYHRYLQSGGGRLYGRLEI